MLVEVIMKHFKFFLVDNFFCRNCQTVFLFVMSNGYKSKVHMRCSFVHVDISRHNIICPISCGKKFICFLEKLLTFLNFNIFGLCHNPRTHHIDIFTIKTEYFGTTFFYKIPLQHRLMNGKVIV
ncbi:hypothetical protein Barb7_03215 [Bacteroidales bacterium Barb7]|nr:hypothetical protein Barb7_03215 [Bacteroidales bacterium Barb7]